MADFISANLIIHLGDCLQESWGQMQCPDSDNNGRYCRRWWTPSSIGLLSPPTDHHRISSAALRGAGNASVRPLHISLYAQGLTTAASADPSSRRAAFRITFPVSCSFCCRDGWDAFPYNPSHTNGFSCSARTVVGGFFFLFFRMLLNEARRQARRASLSGERPFSERSRVKIGPCDIV